MDPFYDRYFDITMYDPNREKWKPFASSTLSCGGLQTTVKINPSFGLEKGDLVVAFDEKPVFTKSSQGFQVPTGGKETSYRYGIVIESHPGFFDEMPHMYAQVRIFWQDARVTVVTRQEFLDSRIRLFRS